VRIVKKNVWGLANRPYGARRRRRRRGEAWGGGEAWERVSPSPIGLGPGAVPVLRNFFNFMAQNCAFWRLF